MYKALEFDHLIGQHAIRWIVLECSGVGRACGGPVALPPRRDIAYFLDPVTAEEDAKEFATFKNREVGTLTEEDEMLMYNAQQKLEPTLHHAYEWDHLIFGALIRWACLKWSGSDALSGPRIDVAYFLDGKTAPHDARIFSWMRDRRCVTMQVAA
jgi:hypothetical protein